MSKAQLHRFDYTYDLVYEGKKITGDGVVDAPSANEAYNKAWNEIFQINDLEEGTIFIDEDGDEDYESLLPDDFELHIELERWQTEY